MDGEHYITDARYKVMKAKAPIFTQIGNMLYKIKRRKNDWRVSLILRLARKALSPALNNAVETLNLETKRITKTEYVYIIYFAKIHKEEQVEPFLSGIKNYISKHIERWL